MFILKFSQENEVKKLAITLVRSFTFSFETLAEVISFVRQLRNDYYQSIILIIHLQTRRKVQIIDI